MSQQPHADDVPGYEVPEDDRDLTEVVRHVSFGNVSYLLNHGEPVAVVAPVESVIPPNAGPAYRLWLRIAVEMSRQGKTMADFARLVGVSPTTLIRLKRNKYGADSEIIARIADALEIGIEEALELAGQHPSGQKGIDDIRTAIKRTGAFTAKQKQALLTLVDAMAESPEPADDQRWYWTPEWQAGEREVDAEMEAGRTQVFTSDEEFDDFLAQIPLPGKTA